MEPISLLQTWFSVTIHFFSLTVCLPVCLQSYLSVYINYVSLLFRQYCGRWDGLMVSVLESKSGSLDSSTGQGTASCSWARHLTLMVLLSTQVATKLKCRLYPFCRFSQCTSTAAWLAQLVGCQSAVREVEGSSPRPDQHSGS